MSEFFHYVSAHVDKPGTTITLATAGVAPQMTHLPADIQMVYYCLLIPPAAVHMYITFKRHCWPAIKKWFDKE